MTQQIFCDHCGKNICDYKPEGSKKHFQLSLDQTTYDGTLDTYDLCKKCAFFIKELMTVGKI